MSLTRVGSALLIFLSLGSAAKAQLSAGPKDGVGLLDYCRAAEIVRQPPETRGLLGEAAYQEVLRNWCLGYVEGKVDAAIFAQAALEAADHSGVTMTGPERDKQSVLKMLQAGCFPLSAKSDDYIFLLNRWLSERPNRLHESRSVLTAEAFIHLLPCDKPATKPEPKAAPPKP